MRVTRGFRRQVLISEKMDRDGDQEGSSVGELAEVQHLRCGNINVTHQLNSHI